MNAFIGVRERILGMFIPSDPSSVLNSTLLASENFPPPDLSVELKQAMDRLKRIAMDAAGRRVDYARLRASPEYEEYRQKCSALLQGYKPEKLPTTSAQLAFWINLYNTLLIDAVIALNIQQSVIEGRLGIISFFRRAAYRIDGKRVSLEDLEQGILRGNRGHPLLPGPQFASDDPRIAWCLPLDPRIHFALNCGSRSCPPFQVYTSERLDEQLELAARSFVSSAVEVDFDKKRICLSKIFKWYEGDFGGRPGIVDFLIMNLPDDHRKQFLLENRSGLHLVYTPYDWGLNVK
jgi:hypothetical protein